MRIKKNKQYFYGLILFLILAFTACGGETEQVEENENPMSNIPYPTDTSAEVKDSIPENEFERYEFIDAYSEGLAKVKNEEGKYGFIDKERKEVIEPMYDEAKKFSEGFAAVRKDNQWTFINKEGKEITNFQFKKCGDFREGLASVAKNEKLGYIDTTGKLKIPYQYEWAGEFRGSLARVLKGKKWGFINQKNEVIIPLTFDAARDFEEGFAAVWTAGKWGYLNNEGDTLIKFQFDRAEDFNKENNKLKAKVSQDGKTFYINPEGECIEGCQ